MTPEQVLERMREGKKITEKELITVVRPVWRDLCVDPKYDQSSDYGIHFYALNTKKLKSGGISDKYSGWSIQREKEKGIENPLIFINTDRHLSEQIRTIGHETSHIVIKKAGGGTVKNHNAEKLARAGERCFVSAFNKKYGTVIPVRKQKDDCAILFKNLKKPYQRKNCQANPKLKL